MIDYRAHLVALDKFRQALAAAPITEPKMAAIRDQHLAEVGAMPEMAVLGSLVDHLVWHAASDGAELGLVERAAALWQQGLALYDTLGGFRADVESALANPADPASVAKFNAAILTFQQFLFNVTAKKAEIEVLKGDIRTFAHLRPHPRQMDQPLSAWTWSDVFLARRTDAFARSVRRHASDPPGSAFAFGVMSSYGANVCGSAYLGQVVGSPRRSHRHRDRLARNTVGSWFARATPGLPSLGTLAGMIRYGTYTPALPASIEKLLEASLTDTFDLGRTPPLPDLQLGYRRMVRHLELLDGFVMPPVPPLPTEPFLTRIYSDPTTEPPTVISADVGVGPAGSGSGSGVTPQNYPSGSAPNSTDSPTSAGDACGAFWEALLLLVILLAGGIFICFGFWGSDKHCKLWDKMVDDFRVAFSKGQGAGVSGVPPEGQTAYGLTAASGIDQVTGLIKQLFDLQCLFWSAMDSAYDYLALHGLIYPDKEGAIDGGRYPQFLKVPVTPPGSWPHLPEADAAERMYLYPVSGIEQPAATSMPYPDDATPDAFIVGVPGMITTTAVDVAGMVWRQTAAGEMDADNYDLDADRGLRHPCWMARGFINDNPIDVAFLPYSAT